MRIERTDTKFLILFAILPILHLTQVQNVTHEGADLLRLFIFSLYTLIILLYFRNYFKLKNKIILIPLLLIFVYLVNQIILGNDITSFILGKYNRFGGLVTLICLTVYFILVTNLGDQARPAFSKTIYITYLLMMGQGILTYFRVLPNDTYLDPADGIVKPTSYLVLGFGNPNIASALMGITLSIHLFFILQKIFKILLVQSCIFIVGLFILYKTGSIQGWLILFFNFAIIVIYLSKIHRNQIRTKLKVIYSIIISIISIALILNIKVIWTNLFVSGNVAARINYWKSSIRIWGDYKLTGVGLDNLGEVATYYRDFELAKQEGLWTIADRSHNVILDHLVNGGLFGFLIWIAFIGAVTFMAFRKILQSPKDSVSVYEIGIILIWVGYLLQSLISVDHLFLTLLGYISAGFIVGEYISKINNEKQKDRKSYLFFVVPLVVLLLFQINQIIFSYNVNQFLSKGNTKALEKIYNAKYIEQQSYLDTVVKLGGDKQFQLAHAFALKLLKINPFASQAYYANSVYYESIKNLPQAKLEMQKAHEFDKFNSVYTLSLGIYEFNLKNFDKANYWLNETIKLNPSQKGIEVLKNSLAQ